MGPLDIANHLLNFAAPAAAVALLLWMWGTIGRPRTPLKLGAVTRLAILFAAGLFVQTAGLVVWGRDGKMLTYAALVVVCASCQWVLMRGWKG